MKKEFVINPDKSKEIESLWHRQIGLEQLVRNDIDNDKLVEKFGAVTNEIDQKTRKIVEDHGVNPDSMKSWAYDFSGNKLTIEI